MGKHCRIKVVNSENPVGDGILVNGLFDDQTGELTLINSVGPNIVISGFPTGAGSNDAADLLWASGTQSEVIDGAGNIAFELEVENVMTLGLPFVLKMAGNDLFTINPEGGFIFQQNGGNPRDELRLTQNGGNDPLLSADINLFISNPTCEGVWSSNTFSIRGKGGNVWNQFVMNVITRTAQFNTLGLPFTLSGPGRVGVDEVRPDFTIEGADAQLGATINLDGGTLRLRGGGKEPGGRQGDLIRGNIETTQINPANLNASEYTTHLDETGNYLVVTAKYSDGSTVGVGQLPLAPQWRDALGVFLPPGSGPTDPDFVDVAGGPFKHYRFAIGDVIYGKIHVPHDYIVGSDVHFHIHWLTDGTDTSSVNWDIVFASAKGHQQGVSSVYDISPATLAAQTILLSQSPSGSALEHHIIESSAITDSKLEPDSMIWLVITRVSNGVTDNTDDVFLLEVDMHYQSNNTGTLNKDPDFYS